MRVFKLYSVCMSHVFNWSQLLQAASEGIGLEQDRGSSSVGSNAWCVHVCRDAGRLEQTDRQGCLLDGSSDAEISRMVVGSGAAYRSLKMPVA